MVLLGSDDSYQEETHCTQQPYRSRISIAFLNVTDRKLTLLTIACLLPGIIRIAKYTSALHLVLRKAAYCSGTYGILPLCNGIFSRYYTSVFLLNATTRRSTMSYSTTQQVETWGNGNEEVIPLTMDYTLGDFSNIELMPHHKAKFFNEVIGEFSRLQVIAKAGYNAVEIFRDDPDSFIISDECENLYRSQTPPDSRNR